MPVESECEQRLSLKNRAGQPFDLVLFIDRTTDDVLLDAMIFSVCDFKQSIGRNYELNRDYCKACTIQVDFVVGFNFQAVFWGDRNVVKKSEQYIAWDKMKTKRECHVVTCVSPILNYVDEDTGTVEWIGIRNSL